MIIIPKALFHVIGSAKKIQARIEAKTGFAKKTLEPAVVFNIERPVKNE